MAAAMRPVAERPRRALPSQHHPEGVRSISAIQFCLYSPQEMAAEAECLVRDKQLLINGKPVTGGVLDPRMGVSKKSDVCETCKDVLKNCKGHFGIIELAQPIWHLGYFKHAVCVLQCICKSCSRVLLPLEQRAAVLAKLKKPDVDSLTRELLYKRVLALCKKIDACVYCGMVNGPVRKAPNANALRVLHDLFQTRMFDRSNERMDARYHQVEEAVHYNGSIVTALEHASLTITPTRALALMRSIPDEDLPLLWCHPEFSRPENLILQTLLVPPVCIRPSVGVEAGAGSTEDDLTIKLQEIVMINENLSKLLTDGAPLKNVHEAYDLLSNTVAQLFNGDVTVSSSSADKPPRLGNGGGLGRSRNPEEPSHSANPEAVVVSGEATRSSETRRKTTRKPIRGIVQRIKGKQGRFRGNLSGKRVDYSGRTVISPDPNLGVHQVGVPVKMAMRLTFPDKVTALNIEELRVAVRKGPKVHPGANSVKLDRDGRMVDLKLVANLEAFAEQLHVGDEVHRHVRDGDIVLFNRQPSLHRMSIMAHEVKVLEGHTLRFNECCCAPYNADFDGDEMNVHVPQTLEACAEARLLMAVPRNLVTPRNGEPLVAATQDFITGSYLLTSRDQFFTKEQFCQAIGPSLRLGEDWTLPIPAILRPVPLWTGKQVWSMIIKGSCFKAKGVVNLVIKERLRFNALKEDLRTKAYEDFHDLDDSFCIDEGLVEFRNNELIYGSLGKASLGGSKSSVFYALLRDVNEDAAVEAMNRMTCVVPRWFMNQGFSFGILDVIPPAELLEAKRLALKAGFDLCEKSIQDSLSGQLKLLPGCDVDKTLETTVSGILSKLRDELGKQCMATLPSLNAAKIMAACGSKGSSLNICQMVICVGQQIVSGERIPNGFDSRALPHFALNAKEPAAKGFVQSSFYSGLSATEFFFHTMAGREGLVDTAVKTAETGYMARRLVKALEDLSVAYDGTVRDASKNVVQFVYGDDGLSPLCVEAIGPVDFARLEKQIRPGDASWDEDLPCFAGGRPPVPGEEDLGKQRFLEQLDEHIAKLSGFTPGMKAAFKSRALRKARLAITEPGEAVGALAAQSLGEPGTQMTLKTFHFAGVASMNVTLGVPRLKEIINASKQIATPYCVARIMDDQSQALATEIKAKIECTTLRQIAKQVEVQWRDRNSRIVVFLTPREHRESIGLGHINAEAVARRLEMSSAVVKEKQRHLVHADEEHSAVTVELDGSCVSKENRGEDSKLSLQAFVLRLKSEILNVVVAGNPQVTRAVVNRLEGVGVDYTKVEQVRDDWERNNHKLHEARLSYRLQVLAEEHLRNKDEERFEVLVEGKGLLDVMGVWGVDPSRVKCNDIIEVEKVLGVEAARRVIINEVKLIFETYGLNVDTRHRALLADVMTYRGMVLGITRFGIAKMKDSVISLASFERTADHLLDGAAHGRKDEIRGVSECIVVGAPIPMGTGGVSLVMEEDPELDGMDVE